MSNLSDRQVRRIAKAKINLALHVTGRRADGYHLLDSLVVFADVGDELIIAASAETGIEVNGPFGSGLDVGDTNLVLRAYRALSGALDKPLPPTRFTLTKNLPVSSGIGGGSADAAAALHGLIDRWQVEIDVDKLREVALSLGADVPVCLASTTCRMAGIGQDITNINDFPLRYCVLVNPGVAVSTPAVFAALALPVGKDAFSPLPELPRANWLKWLNATRNDLQKPAMSVAPEIEQTLHALAQSPDCQLARMSGSGATCFGLYSDAQAADTAAKQIAENHSDWWVVATTIGDEA